MNTTQRIVVVAGCAIAALNFYYVPVHTVRYDGVVTYSSTVPIDEKYEGVNIDVVQQMARVLVVAGVTAALAFAFRGNTKAKN